MIRKLLLASALASICVPSFSATAHAASPTDYWPYFCSFPGGGETFDVNNGTLANNTSGDKMVVCPLSGSFVGAHDYKFNIYGRFTSTIDVCRICRKTATQDTAPSNYNCNLGMTASGTSRYYYSDMSIAQNTEYSLEMQCHLNTGDYISGYSYQLIS